MMNSTLRDLKFGFRMLRKTPGATALAILTLALGIGANSTIFSWISATLLDPIPGAGNTSRLVEITRGERENPSPISYPDFLDLRRQNRCFSGMFAFELWPVDLTGKGKPQRVWADPVSANYFRMLGVHPMLGRVFVKGEDKAADVAPVAVLSYRFWQRKYGGEPSIVGKTIELNRHPFTVVGVAPPAFQGTETGLESDLWIPATMLPEIDPGDGISLLTDRGNGWVMTMARLKPGVTRAQAEASINALFGEIARQYPDSHKGNNAIELSPLWRAPYSANFYLHRILFLLMAISGVVLLLACANEANLLLVRSVARRREVAIRLSLGARRGQLLRQFWLESLLLSLGGGGVAMLVTLWTAASLPDFFPPSDVPLSMRVHAGGAVLLATLAISIIAAALFGVLPALRSTGLDPGGVLKEESGTTTAGKGKGRVSNALVVLQVALSFFLLVAAGLFIRSFESALHFDPGFNSHHVLLESYDLNAVNYNNAQRVQFDRELLAKLRALPGVQSATLANWVPLEFVQSWSAVEPEGYTPQPHESMAVQHAVVGPGYFKTVDTPLLSGREFTLRDDAQSRSVVIVNQAFVSRYWPHQDAIGKRVNVWGDWRTVVGVVRNSDYVNLNEQPRPFVFLALLQNPVPQEGVYLRVRGSALAVAPQVEQVFDELNSRIPLFDLKTLDSAVLLRTSNNRLAGTFAGGFGILALILAAVGIYGVLSYTTRQRTHEIGVRMAFGAQQQDILGLVLRQGAVVAGLGLVLGILASLVLTRALSTQLFGITAADPVTYGGVSLVLAGVSLFACYLPARRATKVDPMAALRHE